MKRKQSGYSPLIHFLSLGFLIVPILFASEVFAISVFINEIHYDNIGTDTGEAIEVAGPAGTNLSGWSLILYSGRRSCCRDVEHRYWGL